MYPCPVCGYFTFVESPGSYDVCAVCSWEDDALQLEFATTLSGGGNALTLLEAQQQFADARDRLARKDPGSAMTRDRDASWRPIDLARDRFPDWGDQACARAPATDETLYYWRPTFWNRDRAS